nr:hypothetical protein GCM10020093_024550 [Planobispora longispora]
MAPDVLDATFAALADPTRRAILARLREGEATVTELAAPFAMTQPGISKHLRVLERAGLISRGRDAQRRPCRWRPLRSRTPWTGWRTTAPTGRRATRGWTPCSANSTTRGRTPPNGRSGDVAAGTGRRADGTGAVRHRSPAHQDLHRPRRLVFDAFTRPELLRRWHGARGWHLVVCEVDLRPGGVWRFVSRGPDGAEMGLGGVFHEVDAPGRLVHSELHDGWEEGEALVTTVFDERDGRTAMTTTVRYPRGRSATACSVLPWNAARARRTTVSPRR